MYQIYTDASRRNHDPSRSNQEHKTCHKHWLENVLKGLIVSQLVSNWVNSLTQRLVLLRWFLMQMLSSPFLFFFMLQVDNLRLFPNYLMTPLICFCFFYRLIDLPLFYNKVDEVPEFELTFSAITGLPLHTGKSQLLYLIRKKYTTIFDMCLPFPHV